MMYPWNPMPQYVVKQPMPQFVYTYPSYNFAPSGSNASLYSMLLLVSLILFIVWDLLLVFCNFKTILKFFELHNVALTIAAVFFIVATLMKVFTMVIGLVTYLGPENSGLRTLESIQIITICVNAAGCVYVLVLSVGVLMPGTLGGLFFDFLLHAGTAAFSALLWKEYNPSGRGWIMVPQTILPY